MRKSELIQVKLTQAEQAIERAIRLVNEVSLMDETGDGNSVGDFMTVANAAIEEINEIGYEICMPLQMEEDARDEEIARLEQRLADLKSQA